MATSWDETVVSAENPLRLPPLRFLSFSDPFTRQPPSKEQLRSILALVSANRQDPRGCDPSGSAAQRLADGQPDGHPHDKPNDPWWDAPHDATVPLRQQPEVVP
jgi:hypothetical protein